ncbi:hypothetical protein C8R47DRAFT_1130766 [Mycena vitilis]|nr:hypothetical protein C8R47DRAFT_1130766 [Mycena vitilis]
MCISPRCIVVGRCSYEETQDGVMTSHLSTASEKHELSVWVSPSLKARRRGLFERAGFRSYKGDGGRVPHASPPPTESLRPYSVRQGVHDIFLGHIIGISSLTLRVQQRANLSGRSSENASMQSDDAGRFSGDPGHPAWPVKRRSAALFFSPRLSKHSIAMPFTPTPPAYEVADPTTVVPPYSGQSQDVPTSTSAPAATPAAAATASLAPTTAATQAAAAAAHVVATPLTAFTAPTAPAAPAPTTAQWAAARVRGLLGQGTMRQLAGYPPAYEENDPSPHFANPNPSRVHTVATSPLPPMRVRPLTARSSSFDILIFPSHHARPAARSPGFADSCAPRSALCSVALRRSMTPTSWRWSLFSTTRTTRKLENVQRRRNSD